VIDLDLTRTAKALEKYDKTVPISLSVKDNIEKIEDLKGFNNALADVQLAFYEDSKDRNTIEECSEISIATIRNWVETWIAKQSEKELLKTVPEPVEDEEEK